MRIALLSYRSKPHVGGQGVYIRHLSRELAKLGHTVEVFSGQPYPELDLEGEGVTLTKVPSLGLYEEPDPFGNPRLSEIRDLVDVEEWARMRTGAFPEPLTFAKRVLKVLKERTDDFDIVHDNQTLAFPLLRVEPDLGLPLVTTIHHPISFDRRIELESAEGWKKKFGVWRWYSFVKMQAKVASQLRHVITPSDNSKRDILTDFGVPTDRVQTVHLGVPEEFVPPTGPRVQGRILAMASADAPLKGIAFLLEAFAKLRTERDLELVLVSKPKKDGPTEQLIEKLAIKDHVRFVNGISDAELVELMGSAEIACVPSLYEGFSLPTAELMACGTPLVVSRAGAIPEVVGPDDLCAKLVTPGDTEELEQAIAALLDDPERRARYSAAGRARVEEHFSWHAVAERMTALYQQSIDEFGLDKLDQRNGRK
ncbi:glycosyltransferase family 4 protein [Nocardioides luteus]|uniref:glycosyltransferase family 4 protein n=1 Tax=Nocardioides luteus TaxID=1844 RepID=UPI0018CBE728|nr:glycosyltransferase family 4 protein [Nocardioides luteus]MBG6096498.1 glycosyltransferase involved in cell wall biosynthesis [Nocardioides luteus]